MESEAKHFVLGKYCIVRCFHAGVHSGYVTEVDGEIVVLKDSRRLWEWTAKKGIALSGVAQYGVVPRESKIDALNPTIYLTGVCEIIPCTDAAMASINVRPRKARKLKGGV